MVKVEEDRMRDALIEVGLWHTQAESVLHEHAEELRATMSKYRGAMPEHALTWWLARHGWGRNDADEWERA